MIDYRIWNARESKLTNPFMRLSRRSCFTLKNDEVRAWLIGKVFRRRSSHLLDLNVVSNSFFADGRHHGPQIFRNVHFSQLVPIWLMSRLCVATRVLVRRQQRRWANLLSSDLGQGRLRINSNCRNVRRWWSGNSQSFHMIYFESS